jgi:hypothetical protein
VTVLDYSFNAHADGFDDHIRRSIPGIDVMRGMAVDLSRHFVRPNTPILDMGVLDRCRNPVYSRREPAANHRC